MRLLIGFLILSSSLSAQIGMQNWRIHFSSFETINITESEDHILMACKNGIIDYGINSKEINTITTTNGLSDLGISAIASKDGIVIIGYSNGNIDVYQNNEIVNIPWLKRALLSGSKKINNIFFNDNLAYLSTSLGILVLNIEKLEILDTYYPYQNSVVYDVVIYNDSIIAATEKGLFKASVDNEFLNDYNKWEKMTQFPDHIQTGKINEIEVFENQLFFSLDIPEFNSDTLYTYSNTESLAKFDENGITIKRLQVKNDQLIISKYANILVYDNELNQTKNIFDYSFGIPPNPFGAVLIGTELWIADGNNGLVRAKDAFQNSSQVYANTPFLDGSYRLDLQKGKLVVAGGGLTHNFQNNYSRRGIYVFDDETWTNINGETNPVELPDSSNWDIIAVSLNPKDISQFAFSSYSRGGLKLVNNDTEIVATYDADNSPLEKQLGNNSYIISDLKYDDSENLWIVNAGNNPLKMLDKDSVWHEYFLGAGVKNVYPYRLMIDSKGYKWVAFHDYGVVVFDDNETIDDLTDDRTVAIRAIEGFGDLPSAAVLSIAEDIDGEVWIGTEDGFGVLYSTGNIFEGGYGDADVSTVVVYDPEKEKDVAIFDKVTISAIAIDGGNRKWVGTSASGVFCMSPNGKEVIHHFNEDNSPLGSNSVVDIKIDYDSGEIYFVTAAGLISYRGDLAAGDNTFSDVKVFPNPVRPEYTGIITIKGVGYESEVRITDISGNLVYQTVSNGDTILWDGNRLSGERVQSGVYLVWSALSEGKGKNVAKILIIN